MNNKYDSLKITVLIIVIFVAGFFIYKNMANRNGSQGGSVINSSTNIKFEKGIWVANGIDQPVLKEVLASTDVSGVFLRYKWKTLNPSAESYDWSMLDTALSAIKTSGKPAKLGIVAGGETPDWVYNSSGIRTLTFKEFPLGGKKNANSFTLRIAVPWDTAYIEDWNTFVQAMASHLHQAGTYDTVITVMINGIARETAETRLPYQKSITNIAGEISTDAPALWTTVGYTPDKVVNAWKAIANNYKNNFPDKSLAVAAITPTQAFPWMTASGEPANTFEETRVNVMQRIVNSCVADFHSQCIAQFNSLTATSGELPVVLDAGRRGATIGWQVQLENQAFPECLKNHTTCDQNAFSAILTNGFKNGSFVEVSPRNVIAYPEAIHAIAESMGN